MSDAARRDKAIARIAASHGDAAHALILLEKEMQEARAAALEEAAQLLENTAASIERGKEWAPPWTLDVIDARSLAKALRALAIAPGGGWNPAEGDHG